MITKKTILILVLVFATVGLRAEYGHGLGGEIKSIYVPVGQQSGWNVEPEACTCCTTKSAEKKMAEPAAKNVELSKMEVHTTPVPVVMVDGDHDGIIDEKDECPNSPAGSHVDATGCPVNVQAIDNNWVLVGVQFENNSDTIKANSLAVLDDAAVILKARSKVRVEIQGHTDSVGDPKDNLLLSERRVASVKNYLVRKGVKASQLETKGFGETVPLGDNSTESGRARNRRIEFKVLSR